MSEEIVKKGPNFIESIIEKDLSEGKNQKKVHTRFPPEPNGYLHIGHAKAICIDFGLAEKFGGKTNLRFDDTNPSKEEVEYVDSIKADIKWLGYDWEDREYYTSDYFEQLYQWARKLIIDGKAYVDDQSADLIASQKGTPTKAGTESPFRNRSVEENLDLFERMKSGEFDEGSRVLRAKIDMASPNMHLRDPLMYRIIKASHHRTGTNWVIYPMYDYAHGQSDYIEGITHSLCTLEFEVHRPLYNWFLDQIVEEGSIRPEQNEFSRLNLSYTVMSKRKLLEMVKTGLVKGWDDPRMPTLSGLRRRGYTPESIRNFAERIGVTKVDGIIDVSLLEHSLKDDLNIRAPRVMAVLDPLKVIITNYPEGKVEYLDTENNPEDESMGSRKIPFSREIFIERNDFMEFPSKKFFRLGPGNEVRLKSAYFIKCEDFKKDENGIVTEVYCTYDIDTLSGGPGVERKVKGTLHWVSAEHAIKAEVRLYDRLFSDPNPDGHKEVDFKEFLNPESLTILNNCYVEPSLQKAKALDHFQFQRLGYYNLDPDSTSEKLVFNRTVPLRDSWGKMSD
ncbi:MAG: glutamine--tRNA ligase/YqeY domain fusion protein [Bacteroidales bacterium]|nr:glutamine--tRNA ligase/YqeY domain fusion protein [Bacteroidales bacterium]